MYLGVLEVSQDISKTKKPQGEKRPLDEKQVCEFQGASPPTIVSVLSSRRSLSFSKS